MDPTRALFGANDLATQTVLIMVCKHLAKVSADLDRALRDAFNEALSKVEDVAIILGEGAPRELTIEAMRILEEMRVGVFGPARK